MGNISISDGADTTFQGPLNHTGSGLVKMTAGGQALFTGKYPEGVTSTGHQVLQAPDWKQGDGLTKHRIAALGMDSEGNISVALSVTTFAGSLKSDGAGAYLQSTNGTVEFASVEAPGNADGSEAEGEGLMSARRLLQQTKGMMTNATKHLVGGRGFLSMGHVNVKSGADATIQGPLNHTGEVSVVCAGSCKSLSLSLSLRVCVCRRRCYQKAMAGMP